MKRLFKTLDAVRAAQILFFLNAVIWVALGVVSLLRLSRSGPLPVVMALVIAIMMSGNAGAMLVSGIGLGKRRMFWFYLALAVLGINIILTFTDEFGLLDFVTLLIDLTLLGLLIATRKRYESCG
jgi:hypothetical protein